MVKCQIQEALSLREGNEMYFPFSVNLKENHEQAEMLQDSFINNKYYYLVENGDHNIDCRLNSLDSFKSIIASKSCD